MAKGDAALQQLQDYLDDEGGIPPTPDTLVGLDGDDDVAGASGEAVSATEADALNVANVGVIANAQAPTPGTPTPQRAAALRAGRVPGQAQAQAAAQRAAQQLAKQQAAQQKQLTTQITTAAQTGVNRVADNFGYVHDRVANAPAPPPGSIWLLVAAQILLILLIFPVNGVPRIGWLWLVLTRQATLAGTDVGGAPVTVQQEEAAVEGVFSTLTGVATTAEGAAAGAAAGAVGAIETWGEGIGARIARYIP